MLTGDASGLEPALAAHQSMLEARLRGRSKHSTGCVDCAEISRAGRRRRRASWRVCSHLRAGTTSRSNFLAVGWRAVRTARHRPPHLHHRTAGQRQDAPGDAAGRRTRGRVRRSRPSCRSVAALKVRPTVDLLVQDGATESAALIDLLAALDQAPPVAVVVDLIEQGLDRATQEALIAHLRRRSAGAPPIFVMTRSSSILDLDAVGAARRSSSAPPITAPPVRVVPHPGTPGYEALASCLATPGSAGAQRGRQGRAAMTRLSREYIA